ncbi:hypothetical protein [Rhodococcus maanshanensis]|uniref:Uncharacterized protein n=1 Tax=Rhodococcus maanshanensis TaxID=183556 RepID=A0A1H7UGZ8_9NOCA|nr:hypothetical protein [Rhodococcus maanshanensis]SEL96241.1 hypothetical protein SAMN05444583_11855 [Rhodococcus maanshanensis]
MSRSSTPARRLAAVATTAALLAAGLLTGTATAGATGSSGGSVDFPRFDPDLQRLDTATVDNVTVTREVVGPNVGTEGEQVTFRTTFAATGAPDRLITRIDDQDPFPAASPSAEITYTKANGDRATETVTSTPNGAGIYVAAGAGWPITGAGATVVLEVTYTWYRTEKQAVTGDVQGTGVIADISGLGTQDFRSMKAQTRCVGCDWGFITGG